MGTADAHIAEWEAVLERERLSPLDAADNTVRPQVVRSTGDGPSAEAADRYLEWARGVLQSCPFAVRGQGIPAAETRRRVWGLHAEGRSLNQIAAELEITRRAVKVSISVTKQEAGDPPPVVNPWRCSGREAEELKLREENDDMKGKPIEYARIVLRESLEVPGVHLGKKDIVPTKGRPLYGTPHAGGIDVEFDTEHHLRGQKRPTRTIITVPWQGIKKAEQVPEEVEPAA